MHATALILALAAAPALVSAKIGPFDSHCEYSSIDASTLSSSCTNGQTSIDLNHGIRNRNGQLIWQDNGGFYGSCGLSAGGTCMLQMDVLECLCRKNDTGTARSFLPLSEHLYYDTEENSLFFHDIQ